MILLPQFSGKLLDIPHIAKSSLRESLTVERIKSVFPNASSVLCDGHLLQYVNSKTGTTAQGSR